MTISEADPVSVNLFTANATLDGATTEPQPWLFDAQGQVTDQAWLPVATPEEITQLLEAGGDIHWMPLTEALRDHVWTEEKTREAWATVWRSAVARDRSRIDAGLAVIREKRAHAIGDGLPAEKERFRS